MKEKELDIFDILESNIRFREYEVKTIPFASDAWFDSADQSILEIARILPNQLTFIYTMLHEFPNQLPIDKSFPGRIQTLIYEDVMQRLKNRTERDFDLERKINQIWVASGGYVPTKSRRDKKNG
ncbi:MAG: hypothetical protein GX639_01585 [Fibrobacter sp.]|mgnify:CR=1 FL=1|nr:hypothetical protein [Fibrobacter sp.]